MCGSSAQLQRDRPIEDLVPLLYPGVKVSYGTIQQRLVEAEGPRFNAQASLGAVKSGALDEMFSQGEPVLAGVDLDSGYLFGLSLRRCSFRAQSIDRTGCGLTRPLGETSGLDRTAARHTHGADGARGASAPRRSSDSTPSTRRWRRCAGRWSVSTSPPVSCIAPSRCRLRRWRSVSVARGGRVAKLAKYLRHRAPGLNVLPRLEALGEEWSAQAVSLACIAGTWSGR